MVSNRSKSLLIRVHQWLPFGLIGAMICASAQRASRSGQAAAAAGQYRVGRPRARGGARRPGRHLGRNLREGDLSSPGGRQRLAVHSPRHHRRRHRWTTRLHDEQFDLLELRPRVRLRLAGGDLVRHRRQRMGSFGGRGEDLEKLDLQSAGTGVAVRGAVGDRGEGRHDSDRHRRWSPDHDQQRAEVDRHRRQNRSAGQGPRR